MLLTDLDIQNLCQAGTVRPMIAPYSPTKKRKGVISYGLSSCGYDVRLAPDILLDAAHPTEEIDPKNPQMYRKFVPQNVHARTDEGLEMTHLYVVIPPHGFALAHTVETVDMPEDVFALCVGKSTYARCGLVVNTTPIEPGWRGQITLELSNTTNSPMRVYINEGIAQLVFFRAASAPESSYATKSGKYQDQKGVTFPKVD